MMQRRYSWSSACIFGCWIAAKKCTAHRLAQSSSFFIVCAGSNESAEPRRTWNSG